MEITRSILAIIIILLVAATSPAKAGSQVIGWGGLAAPSATNPIAVAGGDGFSLTLNADGTVTQIDGGYMDLPPADLTNAISIAAGDNVAIALRADGTVTVWGADIGTVPADLTNVFRVRQW